MNCGNCGGPVTLAPDRHSLVCPYCSTLVFPGESEDGVQVLDWPAGQTCPVCRVELALGWVDDIEVQACPRCRGLLVRQPVFQVAVMFLRARRAQAQMDPPPFNRSELDRRIACPSCGRRMETFPYGGPGNVVIDNCVSCGLIWLDYRELRRITRAAEY